MASTSGGGTTGVSSPSSLKNQASMAASPKTRLEASLCENCYEVFFSRKLFDQHVQCCSEPRPLAAASSGQLSSSTLSKCGTCRRIFLGAQNLAQHMKNEHGTKKVIKTVLSCTDCNKLFMDVERLAKHRQQEHPPAAAAPEPPPSELEPKSEPKPEPEPKPGLESKLVSEPEPNSEPEPEPEPNSEPEPKPKSKMEPVSHPDLELEQESTGSQLLERLIAPPGEPPDEDGRRRDPGSAAADSPRPPETEQKPERPAGPVGSVRRAVPLPAAAAPPLHTPTKRGGLSTRLPAAVTGGLSVTPINLASATATPSLFFACGSCNFMFMDKDLLLKHLAEKHGRDAKSLVKRPPAPSPAKKASGGGGPTYACAMCDARYNSVQMVKRHIEAMHRRPGAAAAAPATVGTPRKVGPRLDTVWSTQECRTCSSLFRPSVRLRDIYISLSEWTSHFYGAHGATEKLSSGKRLDLRPCHRCGLVFVNNTTRLHHNVIAHDGRDPEQEMKQKQLADDRDAASQAVATSQITPKALTAKARSRVIVDSLMKASLVSRSAPTVTMSKEEARRAQSKVFAARTGANQRVTNVVFKCSKCGGMFPDDPSFERHAREAHQSEGARGARPSSPPPAPPDPAPAVNAGEWDVLEQRECSDCSKLMESCPRSFALFVRRDVWERHVAEVHATGRWRCTGERLRLHPCANCPRLFLHPSTLEAHQAKLHDSMLGPVVQAEVDACSPTATLECSRCSQLVQNADGIRYLEGATWHKHFQGEHKELLLCDGKAGDWQLFPCGKCQRLFFSERDLPTHEARQAYMHMPMPVNAKVTTQKRGNRAGQETEILYQCANDDCTFTSREHDQMVSHFQQCREDRPAQLGETVLYKTVMVRKAPPKPRRPRAPSTFRREPQMRRLESVMQKLAPGGDNADDGGSGAAEAAAAVSELLQAEPAGPAVLELDPVTSQPRSAHPLLAAEDVPEAAAEEETVAAEEPQAESAPAAAAAAAAAGGRPTRMDFACSVCKMRGSTRQEIAAHIRRDHKDGDSSAETDSKRQEERQRQVRNYKSAYLCGECKRMAEPCERTRDLFFEKAAWLHHLATTHEPVNFSELDRLDLHECGDCEKLFLSHASVKRHARFYHEEGAENLDYRSENRRQMDDRHEKYKFGCVEEGCTFKYHRITRLRTHLINVHNFDLAVREVVFKTEDEFQEWKKTLELTTNAYFIMRSNVQAKRKTGTFNVRYFGCSRVMAHLPSYKENGKKRSLPWQVDLLKEDMVWRCPAFMKAEVDVGGGAAGIHVSFCPNHYGHDMDPSFGRLTDEDEAEIGGMLRAGLSIQDVLKRMREGGRQQGTPNRKQRVTEAEINRIFEKFMGMKPPKSKRFDPLVGKAVSRSARTTGAPVVNWNADLVTSDGGGAMDDAAGDEMPLDDTDRAEWDQTGGGGGGGARDAWQRVCGEDQCQFTTNSVGFLRCHLRQRHGFAMHIDSAGFASMKDFTRWKRNLEKRTCAKYTCYKSVAPDDPTDPVVTRYYTCHRSGLNSLKRASAQTPPPRRLVLCTGYMKVRCDSNTGEVACEYCASHYGHDARLAGRRDRDPAPLPAEYETVEEDGEASSPVVDQFSSSAATRYSFIREDITASEQEAEPEPERRRRGRPPKKRPAPPRRSRGGKRRRWEEVEEEEEEEEEEEDQEDSFESD